ncbi:histone-like protein 18C [Drosophila mauritiana]|uniref:Histone-like protein 18C n=1 Tax=Drosophila mauritiana TaxID=7226 RepID=A0A6P8JQC6_DROMA|nr:histone-like protein 18C [Drosophila mauritiana]
MSNLKQKDSMPDVAVSKSVKTSRKPIEHDYSDASIDIEEDINKAGGDYASSSGFVNFFRDFKKRYGEYYSINQIRRAAEARWNEMSFRHRCQYSAEPLDTFHLEPDLVEPNSVSSFHRSSDDEHRMHAEISGCADTFFGAGGSNSCTIRKESKCSKPRMRKSCPKPRASRQRRGCAKPKPKCARPRKACARPKRACAKPKAKSRCLKPKRTKPKCSM